MQWYYLDANQQQVPADESELGDLLQTGTIGADTQLWNETMEEWQSAQSLWPDGFPQAAEGAPAAGGGGKLRAPALTSKRSATVGLVKMPLQSSGGSSSGAGSKGQKLSGKAPQRGGSKSSTSSSGRPGSRNSRHVEEDDDTDPETIKQLARILSANVGWMKFVGVMLIITGVMSCLSIVGILFGWLPIWLGVVVMKAAGSAEAAAYRGFRGEIETALERVGFFFKLQGISLLVYFIGSIVSVVLVFTSGMAALVMGAKALEEKAGQPGGFPAQPGFPVESAPGTVPGVPGLTPAPAPDGTLPPGVPGLTPTPAPAPAPVPAPAPGTPGAVPATPGATAPPAAAPGTPAAPAPALPAAPAAPK